MINNIIYDNIIYENIISGMIILIIFDIGHIYECQLNKRLVQI